MKSIARQLEKEYPGSNRSQGAAVMPLSEVIVGGTHPTDPPGSVERSGAAPANRLR